MKKLPNESIDLIITSPPYFNIKDYSKERYQKTTHSKKVKEQICNINDYNQYIN